jgi:hypothetical protein
MKNFTKQKKIEGSIFAVPFSDGSFVYGLVCKGGDMCFFKYLTQDAVFPDELQKAEVLFRVCVNDTAPKEGNWIYVGSTNLVGDHAKYSFYVNKPVGGDSVYVYSVETDTLSPTNQENTVGLEEFGSWFAKNINERIAKLFIKGQTS